MLASLNHLHLRFGPQEVLRDVTWALEEGETWGVIGRNGAGKSTVFKLLLGQLEADEGTVVRPSAERGIRVGHYAQDLEPETQGSVLEETLAAFADVERLQHEMRELEHAMAEPGADLEAVMARYQAATEAFERQDGFRIRSRAEGILFALGFTPEMLAWDVHALSGGQKSRVMLAKAILNGEDLLLLDEPTNHLDLPSLRWLEQFLLDSRATVAVISHDRYFLDRVATSILELERGRSRVYEGNYSQFMEKKEIELEAAEKAYELQQGYIKKQEEFIRRNIAGVNTKQAQGRRTHLARLARLEKPLKDRRKVKFSFPETQRSGDVALVLDGVAAGWEGRPLFEPIEHLQVRRMQKLGIVGLNGTGKSTLLKALSGEIPLVAGTARPGSQVKPGYFDQHHRNLDERNTVFQQILAASGNNATKQDIYGFLAKFQFHEEDWEKPVTVLSGGERARLSMATLIRQGVNLLLLDEPTNHMDIPSMEAMEDAILAFSGAVLLVTHDRYLLGRVADCLLRIHEGRAEYREGSYEDHQAWVDLDLGVEDEAGDGPEEPAPAPSKSAPRAKAPRPPEPARTEPRKLKTESPSRPIDKEKQRALKRLERLAGEAEQRVTDLEERLAALQRDLAAMDPADWQAFNARLGDQKALEEELAYAMAAWEESQTALESAGG
ncbi:MAG: ATP-binding cassette domain-containing protein [Acidobacteria bacterium]|nr:ATP-binding cassette domain-containing protein [Acidobacteriota bacterium]